MNKKLMNNLINVINKERLIYAIKK